MRAARAVHRAILRLAPRAFRGRYADEADAAFNALTINRRRRAGLAAAVLIGIAACLDACRTVARERARSLSLYGITPELRHSLRAGWRHPAHTTAVVTTIGLSAGVLAAVFAFVDPMLFRPLPFSEAHRIVIGHAEGERVRLNQLQEADYFRLIEPTASFEAVGSYYGAGLGEIAGLSQRMMVYAVTPGFLPALRVTPALGRGFRVDEHQRTPPRSILLTDEVWRAAFGRRADVVGQVLEMRGSRGRVPYEVIGVLPAGFLMPSASGATDLAGLVPGNVSRANLTDWRARTPIVARLRDGVSLQSAERELAAIALETERAYPTLPQPRAVSLIPLRELLFGDVRRAALLLFAGAAGVVLVAIVNLAHLIRSRLRTREHELALRTAIGASRWRLARLLGVEIAVYAAAGLGLALAVGRLGLVAIADALPYYERSYRRLPAEFDARVMLLALVVVLVMTTAIYLPAIGRMMRGPLPQLGSVRATSRRRSEMAFVFLQAAVAMTIVVCSMQVSSAFVRMRAQAARFDLTDFTMLSMDWAGTPAHTPARHDLQRRTADAAREQFGRRIAAFTGVPGGAVSLGAVRRAGAQKSPHRAVEGVAATPSAFDLFGMRLLAGRIYTDAEAWSEAPVAVADRRAAELLWPGENPVGKRVIDEAAGATEVEREIVGLVESVEFVRAPGTFRKGLVFTPFSRTRQSTFNFLYRQDAGAPPVTDVRSAFERVDAGVLMTAFPYLPHEMELGQTRFVGLVLVVMTALTVILAAVGLFGMVSHGVTSRAREIAIRMALGARRSSVQQMVVAHHVVAAALGLALGGALALHASGLLDDVRFDLRPDGAGSFIGSAALLLVVVAASSYMPARRAARVDPAITLKAE